MAADRGSTTGEKEMIRRHALQRAVSMVTAPVWLLFTVVAILFWFRYRIADLATVRAQYARIRAQSDAPMLVCGNHLTLVDSFLIAWALGSPLHWFTHPDELPWNAPESRNFGTNPFSRALFFVMKCIPITRGGPREDVRDVLARVVYLLQRGETALLFPEAGRSRTGRVDVDAAAWGVGRVIGALPSCRVLCVYLRGRRQETWSDFPAKGDVLDVSLVCIEPKSDAKGVRRSRDLALQVTRQLQCMEEAYFDGRE